MPLLAPEVYALGGTVVYNVSVVVRWDEDWSVVVCVVVILAASEDAVSDANGL